MILDEQRIEEFEKLEELLRNCEQLDRSSGVIDRLRSIVVAAKELRCENNYRNSRRGFMSWLRNVITEQFHAWEQTK